MSYKINKYAYENAKKYKGITIKPSTLKGKKIDVFKDDKKVASIGDINYLDYAMYIKQDGKAYADERRRLYRIRHKKDNKPNTPGFYASKLLW
jgi:hypothetical protein